MAQFGFGNPAILLSSVPLFLGLPVPAYQVQKAFAALEPQLAFYRRAVCHVLLDESGSQTQSSIVKLSPWKIPVTCREQDRQSIIVCAAYEGVRDFYLYDNGGLRPICGPFD